VKSLDYTGIISEENRRQVTLVCELWLAGELAQCAVATFAHDKHMSFEEPQFRQGG
jgi:hypothetical protein